VNKLIDGFFEHKVLVRVLSVLTAILIWFMVLDSNNPMISRNLSIPVAGNPDVLDDNNLRIVGIGAPSTVDITIRGRRNKVSEVTANDFKVVLDYSQIESSGEVTVKLGEPVYTGGSNIRIGPMNPTEFQLNLERITGVVFTVDVRWDGELPAGYKAVNMRVDPSTITFEDKESLVNKVASVVVPVDAKDLSKTSNVTRRVLVLDDAGKSVPQFDGKKSVNVSFDLVRTIPVSTRISGTPAEDWFVTGFSTVPKEVQVLGKYDALSTLERVQAADIVVDGKEGSHTSDIELKVPEGFTLYGTKPQVQAVVDMEKLQVRELSIPVDVIGIQGMDPLNNLMLRFISTEAVLQVKGKAKVLEAISPEQFTLTLDATGFTEGEYAFPVLVQVPADVVLQGEVSVRAVVEAVPAAPEETVVP